MLVLRKQAGGVTSEDVGESPSFNARCAKACLLGLIFPGNRRSPTPYLEICDMRMYEVSEAEDHSSQPFRKLNSLLSLMCHGTTQHTYSCTRRSNSSHGNNQQT